MLVHTIHLNTKAMKPLSLFHFSSASKSKKNAAASPASPAGVSSSSPSPRRNPATRKMMTKFLSKDTLSDGGDIFEEDDSDGSSNEEFEEEGGEEGRGNEDQDDDFSAQEVPNDLNSEGDEGGFDEDEEYPPFPYYYRSPESLSPERRRLEFLQEQDEDEDEEDDEFEQTSERSDGNSSCPASDHEKSSIDGAHDYEETTEIPGNSSATNESSHEMMTAEDEIFPHLRSGFLRYAATAASTAVEKNENTSNFDIAGEESYDKNANVSSPGGSNSNSKVVGTLSRITRSVTRGRSVSIGRRRRNGSDNKHDCNSNSNSHNNNSNNRGTQRRKEYLSLEEKTHRGSGIKIHLHRSSNHDKGTINESDGYPCNSNINDQQTKYSHLHQLNRLGSAGSNNKISSPQLYLRASSSPASCELMSTSHCSSDLVTYPARDHVKRESSLSRYARRSRSLFSRRSRDNCHAHPINTPPTNETSESSARAKPSPTLSPRGSNSSHGRQRGESLKSEHIEVNRTLIHSSQLGLRHSSSANHSTDLYTHASRSRSGNEANNRRTKTRSLSVKKTGEETNTSLYSKRIGSSQNNSAITSSRRKHLKDKEKRRSSSLPHKASSPPVKNYHYHIQNQNNYYNYDSNAPTRQGDDHDENKSNVSVNHKKLKSSFNSQESVQDSTKISSSSSKESTTYSSSPSHKIHCAICRQRLHSKKEYIQFCNLYFCKSVDGVRGTCFKCACCRRSLDDLMVKRASESNEVGSYGSIRPDLDILKWTKVTSNARGSIIQCGKCTMGSAFPARSLNASSDVSGNSSGPIGGQSNGFLDSNPTKNTTDFRGRPGVEQGNVHFRSQSAPHRVQAPPIEHDVHNDDVESSAEDNFDDASSRVCVRKLPQQGQSTYQQQNQQEYQHTHVSESNNAYNDYVSSTDTDAATADDDNDLLKELHALRSKNRCLIEQNTNLELKNKHLTMAITELSTVASTSKSMESELIQQVASFVAQTNALTAEYQRLVDALTQKDMEIASLRYRNDCLYANSNYANTSGNESYVHTLNNGEGDTSWGGFGGQIISESSENEHNFMSKEFGRDETEGLTNRPTCSSVPLVEGAQEEHELRHAYARSA